MVTPDEEGRSAMKLTVEHVDPETLREAQWNPRRISDDALRRLAGLLDAHGFVVPIVARREDRLVLGGHQRLRANRLRDRPAVRVPVVFLDGVDDERARLLNVGLNNLAAQGRFDVSRLAGLLSEVDASADRAARQTGFSRADLRALQRQLDDVLADVPAASEVPALSRVVLIFEMPAERYAALREQFDPLVAADGVRCHVQME